MPRISLGLFTDRLRPSVRVLHDELNSKCQEAQALTGKLHESERLNVALTTENKEIQRKYELELATRQTLEHTLEESQRSLGDEKEARNRTDASHRECTEKIADSERQVGRPSFSSFYTRSFLTPRSIN